jgi:hypothetical protein
VDIGLFCLLDIAYYYGVIMRHKNNAFTVRIENGDFSFFAVWGGGFVGFCFWLSTAEADGVRAGWKSVSA